MKTVYLIACCKSQQKEGRLWKVRDLFAPGARFRKMLEYAKLMTSEDNIFALSTGHHLLLLDDELCPQDHPPTNKQKELMEWGKVVIRQMKEKGLDLPNTKFVIFIKANYCEVLIPHLPHHELPLKGLSWGESLHKLDELILRQKEMCSNGQGQK